MAVIQIDVFAHSASKQFRNTEISATTVFSILVDVFL